MDSVSSIARMPGNRYVSAAGERPAESAVTTPVATPQASTVNSSQALSSDVTIVTAEGDTLTLSTSRSIEISFATYNSRGQSPASVEAASVESRASREFSLTVQGDLNKDESKDVRRTLKSLLSITRELLKGNAEHAEKRTSKLSRLDQIVSVDANMEFRRTVSMAQAIAPATVPEVPDSLAPLDPPT